jgi:hypothetical protein
MQAAPPAPAVPALESRAAAARTANASPAKGKDARSVEEWIKRIRDLKTEGRVEDAAKELAAFRVAFGQRADALLPPDLGGTAAPNAKGP